MHKFLKIKDPKYPDLLKEIFDPPENLYYSGNLEVLKKLAIAVIGTRKYSEYGEYVTKKIIKELSLYDICIVSGLARGIDTFAHESALKFGLSTIAVLGSGIENIYPKSNIKLAEEICQKNLILSEHPGTKPGLAHHFPLRNRIVSALSFATLVIEAPERSGALITANLALDQGKDVFVIPGDIDRINSKGCLKLLQKSGAYPVSSGKDIINFLEDQNCLDFKVNTDLSKNLNSSDKSQNNQKSNSLIKLKLSSQQKTILDVISHNHQSNLDQIYFKTKIEIPQILSALSMLEIYDLIEIRNGTYYQKE